MKHLLYCLFIAFPVFLFAQANDPFPAELEAIPTHFNIVMKMTSFSAEQMSSIEKMYSQYSHISQDTMLLLAEKLVEVSKSFPDNMAKVNALKKLGNALLPFGKYKEAEQHLAKAKAIAINLKEDEIIANITKTLGIIKMRQEQYDIAIEYFLSSLEVFEKVKDSTQIFSVYFNIVNLYFNLSMLDKAEEYTSKAAEIAELMDDNNLRMDALGAQSSILGQLSVNYYNKSENGDTLKRELYMDSMYIYTDRVLETEEQRLEIAGKSGNKRLISGILISMVAANNNKEDYQAAIKIGKEAELLIDELADDYYGSQNYNYLAISFLETNDYKQALVYAKKSLASAERMGMEVLVANSHKYQSMIYAEMGQYEKAIEHLQQYDSYLLKTNDLEKVQIVTDSDTKFQTVKKENQILAQKNSILELETANAIVVKQRNLFVFGAISVAILGFIGFNFFKIRKDRNDRIAFAEALILAQESERKRIARDLHDGVGQSLLLIKKQMITTHETTAENNQLINDTLEEVRTISRDLHPFQLEKFGLTVAINDVIEKVEKSTALFITKEIENIDGIFSKKEEIHFFRLIQEALNNIVKHADATAAKVSISLSKKGTIAKVMDNGKGYDHELSVISSKSLGLRTMHERIVSMGGQLSVDNNKPTGTIVTFDIPKK